jgi:hypothetical protein
VNDKIQPYKPGGQLAPASQQPFRRPYPNNNYHSSPQCPMCNSTNVQPFSAIYGFGTTNYLSSKGLFIPHAFRRTRRQSVIADKCAPPRKFPWWPTVVLILFSFILFSGSRILVNIADLTEPGAYFTLWLAMLLALIAGVHNLMFFPGRLAAWGRRLLCKKCGASFEIKG